MYISQLFFFAGALNAQNSPPTFTSTPITTINENTPYIYSISTSDVDGDQVTISSSATLPAWLILATTSVNTLAGSTAGFADSPPLPVAQLNYPHGVF